MESRIAGRPVVGVVGHEMVVPRPFGDLTVIGTPRAYVEQVVRVGLRPVLVPGEHGIDLLDVVDALVLTGGGDLDPELSGVAPTEAHQIDRGRDEAEIALVRAAAARRIPVLGCCRGLQVLAVAFGGTLRSVAGHVEVAAGHEVRTATGSSIARLVGPTARTTALHRQAIDSTSTFWRPTAWAGETIEAIEPVGEGWPVIGVQWHPELSGVDGFVEDTGPALFGWLASAAATHGAAG